MKKEDFKEIPHYAAIRHLPQAKGIEGVMRYSFICAKCHKSKQIAGRKMATKNRRDGWICKECVETRKESAITPIKAESDKAGQKETAK